MYCFVLALARVNSAVMLLLTLMISLVPAAQSSPARTIRDIDFKNFIYSKLPTGKCSRMSRVGVRDGKYGSIKDFSPRLAPRGGCWQVTVGPVVYGDVTGDGREDAIVVLYAEMGGTESSNDVFIYTLRHDKPVLLWKFATGDRAEGGLIKTYAQNGNLIVELAGENRFIGGKLYGGDCTGACRPPFFTRTKYQWTRGAFRRRGVENLPFTGW
jgi:hypothetical protein